MPSFLAHLYFLGADDPSLPARCAVTRLVLKSVGNANIFQ